MASPPIGVLLPNGQQQFCDANGEPLAGGFVYTYVPGTTTPSLTYVDQALTTPNTNPIVLDYAGRCVIWGVGSYRQIVTDLLGTLIWDQITSDDGANELLAITDNLQSEINTINAGIAAIGLSLDTIQTVGVTHYTIKGPNIVVFSIGGGGGGAGTNTGITPAPSVGGAGGSGWTSLTGLVVGKTLKITVGDGGLGGEDGNVGGADGDPTIVDSGTQTISTITTNGGNGAVSPTGAAGTGGSVMGADLDLRGEDGLYEAPIPLALGGRAAMVFPFGSGGSTALNGQRIKGNTIVGQNGTQGLVMLFGIW